MFVARSEAASLAIERGFFSRGLPGARIASRVDDASVINSRAASERSRKIERIGATDIVNSCDDVADSRHNRTGVKMRGDIERP